MLSRVITDKAISTNFIIDFTEIYDNQTLNKLSMAKILLSVFKKYEPNTQISVRSETVLQESDFNAL